MIKTLNKMGIIGLIFHSAFAGAQTAPSTNAAFDGLRITLCGTSSPLPAPGRAQACVAVETPDHLYIIDAGSGSAATAQLSGIPLEKLRGILLTHYHSDHISDIGDFNLNSWVAGRPAPLQIIGPEGVGRIVEGLNITYELDRGYRVAHHGAELLDPELGILQSRTIEEGVIMDEDGLQITAFEVSHPPIEPAYGYRLDYGGRSLVISGDSLLTEKLWNCQMALMLSFMTRWLCSWCKAQRLCHEALAILELQPCSTIFRIITQPLRIWPAWQLKRRLGNSLCITLYLPQETPWQMRHSKLGYPTAL